MALPSPWQTEPEPVRLQPASRRLWESWPYVVAAVGSIAVFFMLFQTWMVTPNRGGSNSVDAFGTTNTTTTHINLWSSVKTPGTTVSGVWGILASIAIFVTVFAAVQAIYRGSRMTGVVTTIGAIAVAVFVIVDVIYIRSKQVPVQTMTGVGSDLGSQLGFVVRTLRGTGDYPWPGVKQVRESAHLTSWVWATVVVALASAGAAAIRTWVRPSASGAAPREPADEDIRDWGAAG